MSKTKILIVIAAIVFLGAVALALTRLGDMQDQEVVNRYYGSDFSFTYPLGQELEEYPNGSMVVGTLTADGFSPGVALTLVEGSPIDFESYEAFVAQQLQNLCAADGPNEQLSCEGPFERVVMKNAQGESAGRYDLTLSRTVAGETTTSPIGPIYVYVLSSEGEEFMFRSLIVHHPRLPLRPIRRS